MKTKIGLLLTLFLNLSNNSTNIMAYRGDNLAILSLNILINEGITIRKAYCMIHRGGQSHRKARKMPGEAVA